MHFLGATSHLNENPILGGFRKHISESRYKFHITESRIHIRNMLSGSFRTIKSILTCFL